MKRGAPAPENWRNTIVYMPSGQVRIHWQVYEYLIDEGILEAPEIIRIGESFGNGLICGIGVDYLTLNIHPESITKRFTPELRRKESEH